MRYAILRYFCGLVDCYSIEVACVLKRSVLHLCFYSERARKPRVLRLGMNGRSVEGSGEEGKASQQCG